MRLFKTALLVAALLTAHTAAAQEDLGTLDSAPETAAEEDQAPQTEPKSSGPKLDEIVVTAQKRAENIRDVPISVSAVDSEAMKNANVEDMNDLSKLTPNVRILVRPTTTFLNIRGLGTGENAGFEQSVGLVVDGVYYGRGNYLNDAFMDMQRVEVLRGPQGTLFGKNTIAGALNVTTGQPGYDWGMELEGMMGELDHTRLRGMLNAPLWQDFLAARAAFAREKRDGYMLNTGRDNTYETALDKSAGRLRALVEVGNVDLTVSVSRSLTKQNGNGYQLTAISDDAAALFPLFDPETEANIDFQGSRDYPSWSRQQTDIATFAANYDWKDYTFTLIGGWSEVDSEAEIDADFSAVPFLLLVGGSIWEQQSLELRVASPPGSLEYVAGLYYFDSSLKNRSGVDIFRLDDPSQSVLDLLGPAAVDSLLNGVLGGAVPELTAEEQRKRFDQEQSSYAGFGQATWYISDAFALVGGLRVSYEEKSVDMEQTLESSAGTPAVIFPALLNAEEYAADITRSEWDVSPKVSAKYDWNEDTMLYATYARGYKGGGFNEASFVASNLEFEAEVADTYEMGAKLRLLDGGMTLNVGLFWTKFDNLQVALFNGTQFIVGNAAKATTRGLEWDMAWLPLESLMLTFNGGYTDATYDAFPDGPCPEDEVSDENPACDLTGRTLARAPKWNGNIGVQWNIPLGNLPFGLFVATDVLYQGDTYLTTDLDPVDFQKAYMQWNAGLGLKDIEGAWAFTVFGRNLTDEILLIEASDVPVFTGSHWGLVDQGRTVRAEFRIGF